MSVYNYMTLDATGANAGTSAYDINNAGQIVGSYTFVPGGLFPTQKYGFIYNPQDGTYTGLNDPFSAVFTSAQGINDVGQVVGHYLAAGLYHGFLYSGGTYTTLDAPGATQTQAYGINNVGLGQIVGAYSDGSVNHGFTYDGSTYTTLDDPFGTNGTQLLGINNLGQIVGSYIDASGHSHGFLYSGGGFTTLDDPSGTDTVATGINELGQIVGHYSNGSVQHSFLYSAGAYITLDDTLLVSGINNSGVLVGSYSTHGFFAVPGPNPSPPQNTSADMILRQGAGGLYQIYDIGNNAILAAYSLGQVGTDWAFVTLGGFNDGDTSDMLLRNSTTGGFQIYDISNNNITGSAFLGNSAWTGRSWASAISRAAARTT
jgi:probable HAF family extracellular repeat protein